MSRQTPKPPAPKPTPAVDRRLAKDVARHIDRRRIRRKLFLWALFLTAIVLAALYLTCGRGWGLGGKGKGKGEGSGPGSVSPLLANPDAGPRQCAVRIAASGITADGKSVTVEEAVAACKSAATVEVIVTGGARRGDQEKLKAAFQKAGIEPHWTEKDSGSGAPSGGR